MARSYEQRMAESRRRRTERGHSARLSQVDKPSVFVGLLGRLLNGQAAPARGSRSGLGRNQAGWPRVRSARHVVRNARQVSPPVMTRSPLIGAALNRSAQARRPTRRYDMPVRGVPGAEVRLPSLPQIRGGWRLLSLVLTGALAFVLYFLWTAPTFQVQTATVEGLQHINARDVEIVLDVTGQPIFALNPERMLADLQSAFPEFEQVSVEINLPASVMVRVQERTPVMVWRQEGHSDLVDAQGVAFPLRVDSQVETLPVVEAADALPELLDPGTDLVELLKAQEAEEETANTASASLTNNLVTGPRQLMTPEMVTAVLAMAREAPQATPLVYQSQHGLGWKDRRGWEVFFGTGDQMEMKLRIYDAIVKHLKREDLQPELVSVEYVHAPYYRLER